jgi:hypothetical protein
MIRAVVVAFLAVHGLLHLAIYAAPATPGGKQPFDPRHSWVLAGLNAAGRPSRSPP